MVVIIGNHFLQLNMSFILKVDRAVAANLEFSQLRIFAVFGINWYGIYF